MCGDIDRSQLREELVQRIAALREDEARAWAALNAVLGAIAECNYWLGQLADTGQAQVPEVDIPGRMPAFTPRIAADEREA